MEEGPTGFTPSDVIKLKGKHEIGLVCAELAEVSFAFTHQTHPCDVLCVIIDELAQEGQKSTLGEVDQVFKGVAMSAFDEVPSLIEDPNQLLAAAARLHKLAYHRKRPSQLQGLRKCRHDAIEIRIDGGHVESGPVKMGLDILLGPITHLAFFEVPSKENTCGDESLFVLVAARAVVNS